MTRIDLARASDLGSGIPAGTAFPGSPSTDDLFHRTDRDLIYFYDGTRWLCICPHELAPAGVTALIPASVDNALGRWPVRQDYGMYIERVVITTFVTTTNNGTHYWTCVLKRRNAANSNTDMVTVATNGDTASNWVNHDSTSANGVLDSGARELQVQFTPTGSPGTGYALVNVVYRLIG